MEVDELIPIGEYYPISCPYCYAFNVANIYYKDMPYVGSKKVKCFECGKVFEIKPKYGFIGFYTYKEKE